MKRMKTLLALVMAVVMVLALAIPAFAANGGTIKVANDNGYTYSIYKIFDAALTNGDYTYSCSDNTIKNLIQRAKTDTLSSSGFPDIIIAADGTVTKTDTFSAADFAAWLAANKSSLTAYEHSGVSYVNKAQSGDYANGFPVDNDGYYFITYNNDEPFALTTVDSGKTVQIQNKHDTPFDKDVYKAEGERTDRTPSHDEKSVQLGDTLYYQVTGKVVNVEDNTQYNYLVWDKLSKGQSLNFQNSSTTYADTVKVYVQPLGSDGAPAPNGIKTDIKHKVT